MHVTDLESVNMKGIWYLTLWGFLLEMKPKHGKAGQKVENEGVVCWETSFQPLTRTLSNMSQNCPPRSLEGDCSSIHF